MNHFFNSIGAPSLPIELIQALRGRKYTKPAYFHKITSQDSILFLLVSSFINSSLATFDKLRVKPVGKFIVTTCHRTL